MVPAPDAAAYRILDFVPSGCCVVDEGGWIHFWNKTLEAWTQCPAEGMRGLNLFRTVPAFSGRLKTQVRAVFQSGAPVVFPVLVKPQDFPRSNPGSIPRVLQMTVERMGTEAGGVPLVLVSAMDLTAGPARLERVRTAQAQAAESARRLRESETKHLTVVELCSEAILVGEVLGRILDANSAAGRLFLCDPADLKGQSILDLVNDDYTAAVQLAIELESGTGDLHMELHCRRSDGSIFPSEFRVRRFTVAGEPHFAAFLRDMTEQRRLEEALRQAQKRESLAVLTGSITHDFNNHLGAVLSNLEIMKGRIQPASPLAHYLAQIESEILRASDLSRKMLSLAGKGQNRKNETDLNRLLTELNPLMTAVVQRRARLRMSLQDKLPMILADQDQVQQALMALLANASESFGEREGTITVATAAVELTEAEARERCPGQFMGPGRYVSLRVEDTGCGISPEALPRIFDPFFTTKSPGRGFSLSVVLGILREHKAGISTSSHVGEGTAFTMYFPVPPGAQASYQDELLGLEQEGADGEILLVDDEVILRETTAELLRDLGYRVSTAGDGEQAVDHYRANPGKVALVLMDVTMPRMDGKTAFLAIKDMDPSARVILMSGYSEHDITGPLRDRSLMGFLPKPFRLAQIQEAVETALARS